MRLVEREEGATSSGRFIASAARPGSSARLSLHSSVNARGQLRPRRGSSTATCAPVSPASPALSHFDHSTLAHPPPRMLKAKAKAAATAAAQKRKGTSIPCTSPLETQADRLPSSLSRAPSLPSPSRLIASPRLTPQPPPPLPLLKRPQHSRLRRLPLGRVAQPVLRGEGGQSRRGLRVRLVSLALVHADAGSRPARRAEGS